MDDTIEGVSYTADAQGNPAEPVKPAPQWKIKPSESWLARYATAESRPGVAYSMASRLSAEDRAMLKAEQEKSDAYDKRIEGLVKVMQSGPPVTEDQRIEAGLEVLRIYHLSRDREHDERSWATAIRELISIGKPAVPKLTQKLDRAERNLTLRALGFVLRGIGDPPGRAGADPGHSANTSASGQRHGPADQ